MQNFNKLPPAPIEFGIGGKHNEEFELAKANSFLIFSSSSS